MKPKEILKYRPTVERTDDGRVIFVDVAKALTIFIVVLYHLNHCNSIFANAFFMPLFFFLSGIFFNPFITAKKFLIRECRGSILPVVVGTLAGLLVEVLFYHFQDKSFLGGLKLPYFTFFRVGNVPLWFLIALFFMQFIVFAVENLWKRVSVKLSAYLLFAAFGYICSIFNFRNTGFFGNACLGLPFFVLGYYGKDFWLSGRWFSPLALVLAVVAMIAVVPLNVRNNFHHSIISPYYFPTIFFGLAGIYMILGFSILLANRFKCKWLMWIGESTLFVLILHYLFVPQIRDVLLPMIPREWHMTTVISVFVSILLAALTVFIGKGIRRVLPFMFPVVRRRSKSIAPPAQK